MTVATLPEWPRPTATAAPTAPRTIRAAFLGRTSTDEQQDPTLSILRQFSNRGGRPVAVPSARSLERGDHPVYVTVTGVPAGRVTVSATAGTVDPPTLPDGAGPACTAPLCALEQVDRTTGAIRAVDLVINVERSLAAAVAATRPEPDLAGPVAGVLVHPGIGRLLVVGPFDQPADLDRWWHRRGNRLATAGMPIALTSAPADLTGDAR